MKVDDIVRCTNVSVIKYRGISKDNIYRISDIKTMFKGIQMIKVYGNENWHLISRFELIEDFDLCLSDEELATSGAFDLEIEE